MPPASRPAPRRMGALYMGAASRGAPGPTMRDILSSFSPSPKAGPMRFDLVDLRLFVAVVESGSITRGAEAAHLALASVSARIAGMELALGVPLLERGRRGVVPTAAGWALLHHAKTIAAQVEALRDDLRAFSDGIKGEVRLLSNTAALVDLVPRTLRAFLLAYPGVDVHVEERVSSGIVEAVRGGRATFGVVASTAEAEGLDSRALAADRLTGVAATDHPLAVRGGATFAELLDHPFVGLGAGALHDHLAREAARLGRRVSYRVRLNGFDAVARLVEAGVGVAVLPLAAVERCRTHGLAEVRLLDPWADRRLVVVARDLRALGPHAQLFVEELMRQSDADVPTESQLADLL